MIRELEEQVAAAQIALQEAEAKIEERGELENQRNEAREKNAALKVENESLRKEMDEIKKRIDSLEETEGNAACPVCGQELSEAHRKSTLEELNKVGKEKGDQFRANKTEFDEIEKQITELRNHASRNSQLPKMNSSPTPIPFHNSPSGSKVFKSAEKEWEKTGKKRLAEVTKILEKESFAAEARKQLAKLDKELAKLGYDAAAHESARLAESNGRSTEEEFSSLKSAREVSKQIESEIKNLEEEKVEKRRRDQGERESLSCRIAQTLAESETQCAQPSRSRK